MIQSKETQKLIERQRNKVEIGKGNKRHNRKVQLYKENKSPNRKEK